MNVSNNEQFVDLLKKSHLLGDEQLEDVRHRASESTDAEPRKLAYQLAQDGAITAWQARRLLAGRTDFFLGRYRLLSRIDKGGMGTVFKAQHALMDRVVALKVMSRALLSNPRATARFTREVRAAAALNHPNIITAFDADCVGSTHLLVMEYVDGRDLNFWLRSLGPLPPSLVAECVLQTARGLAHAHHQGMVHRDIKPVNLLVAWNAETGFPLIKLLDMGLARFKSETREDGGLTRLGTIVGTPDYIAPEAAENFKSADIRADIFSLGCAAFKLLTGKLPFAGENTMEKLMARTSSDARSVMTLRSSVSEGLSNVVGQMLARRVEERFQTPSEVVEALTPFAASTLEDRKALQLFEHLPEPGSDDLGLRIEADPDTSLDEFNDDLSDVPLRDNSAGSDPDDEVSEEDFGFAPLEDEPTPEAIVPRGTAVSGRNENAQAAETPVREPQREEPPPVKEAVAKSQSEPTPQLDLDDDWIAKGQSEGVALPSQRGMLGTLLGGRSAARRSVWESPLLLLGGGALALLVLVGIVLLWALRTGTGDEALRLADDDFDSGSYSQAIAKYDGYLEGYPSHVGASHARVRRGLAQLLQSVDLDRGWPEALAMSQTVLGEISTEPKFGEARADIGALLIQIAEGLSVQAAEEQRRDLIEQTRTAMQLFHKYAPESMPRDEEIRDIEASLQISTRQIDRDASLVVAVQEITKAADSGVTKAAYAAEQALVKVYPDLADHPEVREALRVVAEAQLGAVTIDENARPATKDQPPSKTLNAVSLVSRSAEIPSSSAKQPILALAEGAVYALDATKGGVLWRRFVGYDTQGVPQPINDASDSDFVIVDSVRNEVMRIAALEGHLRWRQAFDAPLVGSPLVAGGRLVVTTETGDVALLDIESGAVTRTLQLNQELATGVATDAYFASAYVPARHNNVFVVSLEDGTCRQVFHLGHESGTITAPAIVVDRYLILFENHRLHDAKMHLLRLDESGNIEDQLASLEIDGHMHVAPVVSGNYLYVITDRKAMYAFRINRSDPSEPLSLVASTPATDQRHVVRFAIARDHRFWVGGTRASGFELDPARARISAKWSEHTRDVFLQPLRMIDDVLIHLRRPSGREGVAVAASDISDGSTIWETHLATSPAEGAPPVVLGKGLAALDGNGALFSTPFEALFGDPAVFEPIAQSESRMGQIDGRRVAVLSDGRWAASILNDPRRVLVFDAQRPASPIHRIDLPDEPADVLIGWAGRLLVPARSGLVYIVDPTSGDGAAQPYHPPLPPAADFDWRGTVLPSGDEVLLARSDSKLFRIGVERNPQLHLAASATAELKAPLIANPVVIGDAAFSVDSERQIVSINLTDLKTVATWPLDGDLIWGPFLVGELALLSNDRGELFCLDGEDGLRWKVALDGQQLVGSPLEHDGALLLATRDGALLRVAIRTGDSLGMSQLDESLSTGPLMLDGRLVVAAQDGTFLVTTPP